jgi:hypothetical protein
MKFIPFIHVNNVWGLSLQTESKFKQDPSMRKIIAFMILLVQFSCTKPPQDNLTFKIHYQPEKTYTCTSERVTNSILKYMGSEKSLQWLKSKGHQNPTFSNKKSHTEWVLKTGKRGDETEFPVTVDYVITTSNDGKPGNPVKANFSGKFLNDNLPVFNSIVSDGLEEKDKTTLLQSLQSTFTQLSFPERKVKIGEQFSIENPSILPMEGSTVDVVVTTNYKLLSISEGIAQLDISQQYSLNPKLKDNSLNGSVTAKGHLVYDIAHTIVLNYTLDTEMRINKKLDSFEFELKTNSSIVQTTSIAKD